MLVVTYFAALLRPAFRKVKKLKEERNRSKATAYLRSKLLGLGRSRVKAHGLGVRETVHATFLDIGSLVSVKIQVNEGAPYCTVAVGYSTAHWTYEVASADYGPICFGHGDTEVCVLGALKGDVIN
jgi:hypothetical protein